MCPFLKTRPYLRLALGSRRWQNIPFCDKNDSPPVEETSTGVFFICNGMMLLLRVII